MRQYSIRLDIDQPAKQPTSIVLNQANLDSVNFIIKIYQNDAEVYYFNYGAAEMVFQKPDGNNVVDDAELHEDGVHYDLRRELFEAPGMVSGYVNLYSGPGPDMPVLEPSELTATLYFTFMIVSDLLNVDMISKSYIQVVERVLSDIYNIWAIIEQISDEWQNYAETMALEWSNLSNTPTDLAGYGITDAIQKTGDTVTGQLVLHKWNGTDPAQLKFESETTYMVMMPSGQQIVTPGTVTYIHNHANYFDIERHEREDNADFRKIRLNKNSGALADALQFIVNTGGAETIYRLFGTHNLPNAADYEGRIAALEQASGTGFSGDCGCHLTTVEKAVMIIVNGVSVQMKDTDNYLVYERTLTGNIVAAANTPVYANPMYPTAIRNILSVAGWFQKGGGPTKFNYGGNYNWDDYGVNVGVEVNSSGTLAFYSRSSSTRDGLTNCGYSLTIRYTKL